MDGVLQGGSIDPFVEVNFAGISIATHSEKNNPNPVFLDQLEIPITMPCMANRIAITVKDYDNASKVSINISQSSLSHLIPPSPPLSLSLSLSLSLTLSF
jgi:Ca2+-dependent lipid-binding protein